MGPAGWLSALLVRAKRNLLDPGHASLPPSSTSSLITRRFRILLLGLFSLQCLHRALGLLDLPPTASSSPEPPASNSSRGRACIACPPLVSYPPSATHCTPASPVAEHRTSKVMTNKTYLAFLDNSATEMLSRAKVPGLSALPSFIPHRVRRKWRATRSRIRSRQSPTSSIASLETSFSPADTLRSLRTHPWSIYDGQYLILAIVAIFSLCVSEEPGPFAKTFTAALLMLGLVLPITRQFLLPFLPALTWLLLFSSCKYVVLTPFPLRRTPPSA